MLKAKFPMHPGEFVKIEVIDSYGLSVTETAKILNVTRQALSHLINAHSSLTIEMAARLQKAFGFDMSTLMFMQTNYDICQAEKIRIGRVTRFRPTSRTTQLCTA